jgi:hypothetical protein
MSAKKVKINQVGHTSLQEYLGCILVGTLSFFVVTGGRILCPSNIAWLSSGDPSIHYLGWLFFRQSSWGWPLGINPNYGIELSSSIFFSDSLPLIAIFFKLISTWLPKEFQYFGLWAYMCFLLQALMAWHYVGLIVKDTLQRYLSLTILVFSPPFLARFSGHYSLCAHWIILIALFLNIRTSLKHQTLIWIPLFVVSSLVHAYLLAMVGALWVSNCVQRVKMRREGAEWLIVEILLVLGSTLISLWMAGSFVGHAMAPEKGFGLFQMNVLAPIDSNGWSYLLPDIPGQGGYIEGFNYFGLGGLGVLAVAIVALIRRWKLVAFHRKWSPFLVVLVCFSAIAISNNIEIGMCQISFEIPSQLSQFVNHFRSSGRMFWPVYYIIFWLALWLVVQFYRPITVTIVLSSALAIQIFDTSAGWLPIRKQLSVVGVGWQTPLKADFWIMVPKLYHKIRFVPAGFNKPNYKVFAYFAAMNGMSTDAVMLARIDMERYSFAVGKADAAIREGNFERDSLYVLDEKYFFLAGQTYNAKTDFLAKVDNFMILAPDWKVNNGMN